MSDTQKTDDKPAIPSADLSAVNAAIEKLAGVVSHLAEGQAALSQAVSARHADSRDAEPETGKTGQPLTESDLTRLLDDRDARRDQARRKTEAADRYKADKLKDLPGVYRDLLPQTDDAAELARAEQQIRDRFKADRETLGVKTTDVGGDNPGGASPAATANAEEAQNLPPAEFAKRYLPSVPAAATTST